MAHSDEYNAYIFKTTFITYTFLSLSALATILTAFLLLVFIPTFVKRLIRATTQLHDAGRVLKTARLNPVLIGSIATDGPGGIEEKQVCDDYKKMFEKGPKLVAKLFGIDKTTKDFVKLYKSKFLKKSKSSHKKKTSGAKKTGKK